MIFFFRKSARVNRDCHLPCRSVEFFFFFCFISYEYFIRDRKSRVKYLMGAPFHQLIDTVISVDVLLSDFSIID